MKGLIRSFIYNSFGLYVLSQIFTGLKISGGLMTFVIGGAALALLNFILRPVLMVISFPFQILTLGAFSIVINGVILFLLTKFVPKVSVMAFSTPSFTYKNYTLPSYHLNYYLSIIFLSFALSFLVTIATWLTKE